MKKPKLADEYMNEIVNYGGVWIPRYEMIRELTAMAEATGHPNPQSLVGIYLAGHAKRNRDR